MPKQQKIIKLNAFLICVRQASVHSWGGVLHPYDPCSDKLTKIQGQWYGSARIDIMPANH